MQTVDISEIYPQQAHQAQGISEEAKVTLNALQSCLNVHRAHQLYTTGYSMHKWHNQFP